MAQVLKQIVVAVAVLTVCRSYESQKARPGLSSASTDRLAGAEAAPREETQAAAAARAHRDALGSYCIGSV